jgi:hypothetical protein
MTTQLENRSEWVRDFCVFYLSVISIVGSCSPAQERNDNMAACPKILHHAHPVLEHLLANTASSFHPLITVFLRFWRGKGAGSDTVSSSHPNFFSSLSTFSSRKPQIPSFARPSESEPHPDSRVGAMEISARTSVGVYQNSLESLESGQNSL